MNPNATIYVTFLAPNNFVKLQESSNSVKMLREYPNIKFKYVNIKELAKQTPLQEWLNSDSLNNSKYVVSHTSDVLRYLLLYKFSGLYLDMDVISIAPYGLINLDNYVCAESDLYLNGAVMKLSGSSGRKIAESFLM